MAGLTRRDLVRIGAVVAGGFATARLLAACGGSDATGTELQDTGTELQEDLVTAADPLGKWGQVNDPFYYGSQRGYDYSNDPYIVRNTGGGDPHVPIQQSAGTTYWRRHKVTPGVQSIFDAGVPNSSTRTQLISGSRTSTFWLSRDGDHNWHILSHRRHGEGLLPVHDGSVLPGGTKVVMVSQWKTFKDGGGQDPILSLNEWSDGYHLVYHDRLTGQALGYFIPCANNVWVRFRLECLWSTNAANARFALWGDTDEVSEKLLVGPITGHRTLYPSNAGAAVDFSHGPYCGLHTPSGTYYSDYANFQVCAYA